MLLAFDTSTTLSSIALYDGRVVAEYSWLAGMQHSSQLMPRISRLLADNGVEKADLTALGVAVGPGSYTGIRVALGSAQGLAATLGVPVFGVSSLETLAWLHRYWRSAIVPVLDAGMGQFSTAIYAYDKGVLRQTSEYGILKPDELLAFVPEGSLVCGEMTGAQRHELAEAFAQKHVTTCSPALSVRRAGALAEIAWRRFKAGEEPDGPEVKPIYLRRPSTRPHGAGAQL